MTLLEIDFKSISELIKNGGSNIWTIVITIIAAIGGTKAWEYYARRADLRSREKERVRKDSKGEREFYVENLKERVNMLEAKLEKISTQREELLHIISDLKIRNATLELRLQSKIIKSRGVRKKN